jgi:hypothetical protein
MLPVNVHIQVDEISHGQICVPKLMYGRLKANLSINYKLKLMLLPEIRITLSRPLIP